VSERPPYLSKTRPTELYVICSTKDTFLTSPRPMHTWRHPLKFTHMISFYNKSDLGIEGLENTRCVSRRHLNLRVF
jgi:hypothetical protein